jgi:ribosomal subunit interface protein
MDIKVERDLLEGNNYFDSYAREQLQKYFLNYPFIESIKVFFRGKKHPSKKVKLQARLKGKDVFVEASGDRHDLALDNAVNKLKSQVEKYKSKRYKRAS